MSAADLIAEAAAAGVTLSRADDNRLKWRSAGTAPPDLLARIAAAKADVLAELERVAAADLHARLERMTERFYVRAGYARALPWEPSPAQADVIAFRDMIGEWRHRSPPAPAGAPDSCARCRSVHARNAHGAADGGSVWLCRPCWPAFDAERDATARASILKALKAAQARGLLDDVDIAALEAAPPRATVTTAETFDADLREGGR